MNRKSIATLITLVGIAILALASTVLLAQDDELDDIIAEVNFRPISEITDDSLQINTFFNDGAATLPIFTNVPVACTIVYGTTTEFGQLTLDDDMAGGAHQDHSPLLTGLEPETEYFYRVQGTDAAGNFYVSEVMTFTTPAFEAPETDNLLSIFNSAEVIGYSSAFDDAGPDERWGVNAAFDDNPGTAWSSDGDGDDAWIEVEMAQRAQINRIEFRSRSMTDGSAIVESFTITTDDGSVYGPFDVPGTESVHEYAVDFVAKTLRFDVESSTGGNTGAVDIAAFGTPVE